jgi:hypothetical protein
MLSVVKASKTEPTDHGGRCHFTAAMVPHSQRHRILSLAIIVCDKTMLLKLGLLLLTL